MEGNTKFFIGIDVSKFYFDTSLMVVINHLKQPVVTLRFDNTPAGMREFDKWLKKNKVKRDENTLLVIENTGIYHRLIWAFCSRKRLPIHIGNSARIKWSFGIARGKNDRIDSIRLCQYACRESDELKATPVLDPVLLQLKDLFTCRSRLLCQLTATRTYLKELQKINDKPTQLLLERAHKAAIDGLAGSIQKIELLIKRIITDNDELKKNYNLLITVPGIGHLTAVYLICCTCNFADKHSGKQLACYAGVVPFEHSSGISIKGRNRVHSMANKELKKMLHLCAMSAIQYHWEFKKYYERKKKEGKSRMCILNAVRNKIILRAAAVVNKQKAYVSAIGIAA